MSDCAPELSHDLMRITGLLTTAIDVGVLVMTVAVGDAVREGGSVAVIVRVADAVTDACTVGVAVAVGVNNASMPTTVPVAV